jgi:hypothetical protein
MLSSSAARRRGSRRSAAESTARIGPTTVFESLWPFRKTRRVRFYASADVPTDSQDLARTMELAGFFMSHAVWCVSMNESLTPLIGFEDRTGWHLLRLDPKLEQGVERGQRWVESNPEQVARASLIFDGYYTTAARRTDALLAKIIPYGQERWYLNIILPYRHAGSPAGFAVHRPKMRDDGENEDRKDWLMDAFFHGSDLHEQGAAIWHSHLDESF